MQDSQARLKPETATTAEIIVGPWPNVRTHAKSTPPPTHSSEESQLIGEFRRILRYGLVGLAGLGVHAVVSLALLWTLPIAPLLAHTLGFAAGFCICARGHGRFTFRVQGGLMLPGLRFALVTLVTLFVSYLALIAFGEGLGWPATATQLATIVVSAAFSYVASRNWAFAPRYSSSNNPV